MKMLKLSTFQKVDFFLVISYTKVVFFFIEICLLQMDFRQMTVDNLFFYNKFLISVFLQNYFQLIRRYSKKLYRSYKIKSDSWSKIVYSLSLNCKFFKGYIREKNTMFCSNNECSKFEIIEYNYDKHSKYHFY